MAGLAKQFRCENCHRAFKSAEAQRDHSRDAHGIALEVVPTQALDPGCLECGATANLVGGQAIYPHRADLFHKRFWLCDCGAYCGCHGLTCRPLGRPAGAETRKARNEAHIAFDPLWRFRRMDRRAAYTWLAKEMNLAPEECHIGMMTAAQAREVVSHCTNLPAASISAPHTTAAEAGRGDGDQSC